MMISAQINCTDNFYSIISIPEFPVESTNGERTYALSSGQALFLQTDQSSLESSGAFHTAPE
jgi:hypothetical protein